VSFPEKIIYIASLEYCRRCSNLDVISLSDYSIMHSSE